MKLLVVSNMAHYLDRGRVVCPWRAAAGEIDALASISTEVRHLAAIHGGEPPPGAAAYRSRNVTPVLLPAAGGKTLSAKARVLAEMGGWRRAIERELDWADAVQLRAPCNVALPAMALLARRKTPERRWIKYAGDWAGRPGEPVSYRAQRAFLRSGATKATIGVTDPNAEGAYVRWVPNPSLTAAEVREADARTRAKRLSGPLELLFAGRLEPHKGADRAIEILGALTRRGVDAVLGIAGLGSDMLRLRRVLTDSGVASRVYFHGWLDRRRMQDAYEGAHCLILPSETEGWPKVASEALAYRCIPFCGDSGGAPAILAGVGAGAALPPFETEIWADRIAQLAQDPTVWRAHADRGRAGAARFTYESYLEVARELLHAPPAMAQSATATIAEGRCA